MGGVGKESEVAPGTECGVWEVSGVTDRKRVVDFHCGAGRGRHPTPVVPCQEAPFLYYCR